MSLISAGSISLDSTFKNRFLSLAASQMVRRSKWRPGCNHKISMVATVVQTSSDPFSGFWQREALKRRASVDKRDCNYTVKKVCGFPVSSREVTKLSLGGNNLIILARGEIGNGKTANLFLPCIQSRVLANGSTRPDTEIQKKWGPV